MPKPPAPPEPEIHRAARVGDVAALGRCVAAGADVNTRCDLEVDNGPHLRALTPLMVAARSVDGATVETLRWLLEHGANLRALAEGGETAAWYSAGKGGRWAFHEWKHCSDHVERLRFLLDAGLDPLETNFVGRSLLCEACEAGDPARVALLLERGARVHVQVSLEEAERRHKRDLKRWGEIAQSGGAVVGAQEMAAFLGEVVSPVSTCPNAFEIPLYCAAQSGSAECVRLLLKAGADPKAPSEQEPSALFVAGSPEVARTLLEVGADLRLRDRFGKDAFTSIMDGGCCFGDSCGPGRFATAKVLVEAGADIDGIDKYPHSRLAEAAFAQNADAVDFLLSLGAKTEPSPGAPTALHSICWQGEYQDPEVNARCERIIRTLVAAGIPVNARDAEGKTPLHEAAAGDWGNETAVRVLLELGATADSVDNQGVTPLMCAAEHPRLEVVRLLLEAGADPDKADSDGRTALSRARGYQGSWVRINQEPPEGGEILGESAHEAGQRHMDALDGANAVLQLLERARHAR